MRIRLQAGLCLSLAAVVILTVTALYALNLSRLERTREIDTLLHKIVRGKLDLNLLTADYLRAPSERVKSQWMSEYCRNDAHFASLTMLMEPDAPAFYRLKRTHNELLPMFLELISLSSQTASSDSKRTALEIYEKRLGGQLLTQMHAVGAACTELGNTIQESRLQMDRQQEYITICGALLLLAALLVTCWQLFDVARNVRRLQQDTVEVGRGNLNHKVRTTAKNEFGELAASFNAMVQNLQAVTTSHEALNREIEVRKEAEARLQDTLRRLERSNRELEQFAFAASHDLQEPLRKILMFGERLNTSTHNSLNDTGRDALNRMLNAAARMQTLVNGLLTLSLISRSNHDFKAVDLNQVARKIQIDLEADLRRTGGSVFFSPLPIVEANPLQMEELLMNLIGNGLKFSRQGVPPVVKVNADSTHTPGEQPDIYTITVEDNGIGFDDKYRERIFGIFQRLNDRSQFEGCGIGLAVCRKIIENHGGRITAEGRPGQGAKIILQLPRVQPAAHPKPPTPQTC